jgi:hypothetical protein
MAQISVELLMKRREQLIETHRQALNAVEQTRGAIALVDEMLQALESTNGAEPANDVEATDSPERQLSS